MQRGTRHGRGLWVNTRLSHRQGERGFPRQPGRPLSLGWALSLLLRSGNVLESVGLQLPVWTPTSGASWLREQSPEVPFHVPSLSPAFLKWL